MATTADGLIGPVAGRVPRLGGGLSPRWVRVVGYTAAVLALVSAAATFVVLLGLTPIDPTLTVTRWALIINGAIVVVLVAAMAAEVAMLWLARRRGVAGARLHIRIVGLFSVVAAIPALLVAFVAVITLSQGLDRWFSTTTQAIVDSSVQVADSYMNILSTEAASNLAVMRREVEVQATLFTEDPTTFGGVFGDMAAFFRVSAYILNSAGEPLLSAPLDPAGGYIPPRPEAITAAIAQPGLLVTLGPSPNAPNTVGALSTLSNYPGSLLYVFRGVDPQSLENVALTLRSATAYGELREEQSVIQLAFGMLYLGITLVLLLVAIWLGLAFANRLVSPMRRLIDAADGVAAGDLNIEVPVRRSDGDMGAIGRSFNKMTHQLRSQRDDLLSASEQIDSRRRFMEAVLSGVTAGVIGVDGRGQVTVVNRTAQRILNLAPTTVGTRVVDAVPELAPVMTTALGDDRREHRDQVALVRGGQTRTINVRVTTEITSGQNRGYVITLDDITDLVTAQRTSAWADVARRIAHEIKNPLTPIQLSAERLRRKFGAVIANDRDVFEQCTATIIRQVADIGRMVDEFSAFARMPKPALEERDLREPMRDAVLLMQVGYPEIDISVTLPADRLLGRFDSRMISQALTNLIKNAAEAIAALSPPEPGRIVVAARHVDGDLVIEVVDNGIGLPPGNRERLLEPYMTTREKGTGLGLAIVRKIVEEHGGTIELLDAPAVSRGGHGAMVRLSFPAGTPAATPVLSAAVE